MATIVGVRFRNAGKLYYFSPGQLWPTAGDAGIVETVRGVGYRLAAGWSPGGLRHEDGPSPEQKRTDTDTSGGRPAGA